MEDEDTWYGVCLQCLVRRLNEGAIALARELVRHGWDLPDSLWTPCERCGELHPVDQVELYATGWACRPPNE